MPVPVPGTPVTPVRPPSPGHVIATGGLSIARRALFWYDLFNYAAQIGNPLQPGSDPQWELGGAWVQVCGPQSHPGHPYAPGYHWQFFNSANPSPTLCGLGGQAFTNVDNTPTTSSKSLFTLAGPNVNLLPAERWFIMGIQARPENGEAPVLGSGRNPRFVPGIYPPVWPTDLPMPEPFLVPGALPAPVPLPTPWPAIPSLPSAPAETGVQWFQRGNIVIGNNPTTEPGTGTQVFPRVTPRPNPKPQPRPRPREREIKKEQRNPTMGKVLSVVGAITEWSDFVGAMYKSLPSSTRRAVWRENDGFVGPLQQSEALWTHWRQINVEEALRQYLREQITDWAYAQTRHGSRFYGQETGSPIGFQAGSADDQLWDLLSQWVYEETGSYPQSLGDVFDYLWSPSTTADGASLGDVYDAPYGRRYE